MDQQDPRKVPQSSVRGLYKNGKISVRTLDKIIVTSIIAVVILVLYGVANNGYTVTFDSRGGTDVPSQTDVMYGEYVEEPEPPTREGYVFAGWYSDENCQYEWVLDEYQVSQSMTLYAGWEESE